MNKEWNKLTKSFPFPMLIVSHLLVNCYECCNRDQAEIRFGLMPLPLGVYLGEETSRTQIYN
jgi:hypothetical protein